MATLFTLRASRRLLPLASASVIALSFHSPPPIISTTQCEPVNDTQKNDAASPAAQQVTTNPAALIGHPPHETAEQESCASCLFTGIATCTGLSLYFAKLALLEIPDITKEMSREVAAGHRRNRAGFLAVSAFCASVGAYRWHLG